MNRTERLLDLITYLLNAKEPVSWRKIKNHFPDDYARGIEESNQRKFERDKAELISLGIPIDYQSTTEVQKEGYLIRKEKLFLPAIEFSPQESSLMMLSAGAVLENEDFPYREQLESALHKIISLQSQLNRAPEEIKITYADPDRSTMQAGTINKIQDALDRRKTVDFTYHAFSTGETTCRKVDPYGMIYRKGKWILIGWDHLRQDLRTFVVNRISDLEVNLKRPGTPDYGISPDFTLKVYQNQQQWELGLHEPVDVIIEVLSLHRMNELLPQLTGAESLDGSRFKLEVTNLSGLISWVLSQKSEVVVVEPSEVREQITETLRALL
ncbi:MAG: WYL domain-containing protein [Acidobacteriota bacterium]|nr:MAG: WYL domain-containing protein [Acidobacteriota bacterium]